MVVNGVTLTGYVKKATIKTDAIELDPTVMGSTYKAKLGGLKEFHLDIEWVQDFGAALVDATIFPILGNVVAFSIKPTSAAGSATNPTYSGSVLVKDYTPLDGTVGDLAKLSTSWPGSGVLNRFTT